MKMDPKKRQSKKLIKEQVMEEINGLLAVKAYPLGS